ncbi:hypothetical protein PL8927_270276 [Planktothrix serta PCC 8927]|uniref:Uncharacterized protein n=1 Tax=Planktothrix serta PCC 8927 TaxID=671068 RepID=A0A7Z9BPD1_9CYAN|nr:hypothetical protein PL8927_270276 [Planktothrix serta PCC 8927]
MGHHHNLTVIPITNNKERAKKIPHDGAGIPGIFKILTQLNPPASAINAPTKN